MKRLTEIRSDCELARDKECVRCRCRPQYIWTNWDEIYLVCEEHASELKDQYSDVGAISLEQQ